MKLHSIARSHAELFYLTFNNYNVNVSKIEYLWACICICMLMNMIIMVKGRRIKRWRFKKIQV